MNFLILSLAILYGVAATPISSANNNQMIIGGFDAYPGQFPYQALIRHSNHLEYLCGGSIISKQWILTSASCTGVIKPNKMIIVVGSIYLNTGGSTHTVNISIKHPDFLENFSVNDIGVIKINAQISYNDFVQPIELTSDSSSVGLPFIITGWGATSFPPEPLPNTLQYATLKSISLDECRKLMPFPIRLFDTQLCTHSIHKQGLCTYCNVRH